MSKYDDLTALLDETIAEAREKAAEEAAEEATREADDGTYERIVADLRTMLAERDESPEFLRGVAWVAQMMIDEGWCSKEAQERSPLPDLPDTER